MGNKSTEKTLILSLRSIVDISECCLAICVEIHQGLLSQFSQLEEFLIGKVPVEDQDKIVLILVNLTPLKYKEIITFYGFFYKFLVSNFVVPGNDGDGEGD